MTSTHSRTPTTMTARCPEDLLAMVPVTLGFVPSDSVAMLTFGAEHTFHARVDLPASRDEVPELVESLLEPAVANGVRRVVLVVYTADEELAGRAWRALRDAFAGAGVEVLEALRADGRRWFPLLRGDRLVREIGVPYDVRSHPFLVESVLRGRLVHRSRDGLAAVLRPRPDRVAGVASALAAWPERWSQGSPPDVGRLLAEGAWVEALVRRHVALETLPSDEEVARLLRALPVLRLRDAAWCTITRAEAHLHVELWTDVLQRAPAGLATAPAALLGWAAWQAGHGALAWCAIEVVLSTDPDYTLVGYLASLLEHAVPPSTWESDFDWAEGLVVPDG